MYLWKSDNVLEYSEKCSEWVNLYTQDSGAKHIDTQKPDQPSMTIQPVTQHVQYVHVHVHVSTLGT